MWFKPEFFVFCYQNSIERKSHLKLHLSNQTFTNKIDKNFNFFKELTYSKGILSSGFVNEYLSERTKLIAFIKKMINFKKKMK